MFRLSPFSEVMPAAFSLHKNSGGYYYELTSSVAEKMLTSVKYPSSSLCRSAIKRLQDSCRYAHHFEKKTDSDGQHYFVVKDKDGGLLATSECFWSASSRDYAIMTVKRECENARVRE